MCSPASMSACALSASARGNRAWIGGGASCPFSNRGQTLARSAAASRPLRSTDCGLSHADCTSAVDYLDPHEGPGTPALKDAQPVSPLRPAVGARVP